MNCRTCGKKVAQSEGRRAKLYCSHTCKQQYWHKVKPREAKVKVLSMAEYDALMAQLQQNAGEKTFMGLPVQKGGMQRSPIRYVPPEKKVPGKDASKLRAPKEEIKTVTGASVDLGIKGMPEGLDRVAQMRWLRENT